MSIIRVKNLSKQFKDVKAVNDLSFSVEEGEVHGFLGQNGAGKSTTIRMLLTLIEPTAGSIEIFGMDLRKHRKKILQQTGAIIEKPDLYKYLSAMDNVRIFSRLSGQKISDKRIMEQLAMVGLAERAQSKVKTYSQGMKQRLGLACALIHDPRLIILDEPTNGLDPQGIADMRNMILHLSRDLKKTLLVSSHLLSEIEVVADSMLIIHKGRKVVEGRVKDLVSPSRSLVELVTADNEKALNYIKASAWSPFIKETGAAIKLEFEKERIPAFAKDLVTHDIPLLSIRQVHSLEEYFLSLTKA
jgi:ABC-type multidrug transport system ATPase subunit